MPAARDLSPPRQLWPERPVHHVFSVGQLVRTKERAGGIGEIVRILPVLDHGVALYVVRNEQGAEIIVRHHEIGKA